MRPAFEEMTKGKLLLFVNEHFQDHARRNGADADIKAVRNCFKYLDFDVKDTYRNFTTKEVFAVLKNESKQVVDYDCLFIIIITHSASSGQLLSSDGAYKEEEVINFFKGDRNKNLVLTPKYFIFQASMATDKYRPKSNDEDANSFTHTVYSLPVVANIFAIKSSFERSIHSDKMKGSYFIKIMCQFMENFNGLTSYFDVFTAVLLHLKANRGQYQLLRDSKLPEIMSTLIYKQFSIKGTSNLRDEPSYVDTSYKNFTKLGRLYVFNYNSITIQTTGKTLHRSGTTNDLKAIQKSFESLGFNVIIENDRTTYEVLNILNEAKEFSEDTCVAVAMMTHGNGGKMLTSDSYINETDLIAQLSRRKKNSEDLVNKPIFYFLQVCRGNNNPKGVTGKLSKSGSKSLEASTSNDDNDVDDDDDDDTDGASFSHSSETNHIIHVTDNIPLQYDDNLVFHSTYRGDVARRSKKGSWFIQTLCEKIDIAIKENTTISLIDVLQDVQKSVAFKGENKKQMPVIHSTLTKKPMFVHHIE